MPKQLLVAQALWVEDSIFTVTLYFEAVHDLKGTVAAGVLHVLINKLIGHMIWFKLCDIALQLSIMCIDRVYCQHALISLLLALFLNL